MEADYLALVSNTPVIASTAAVNEQELIAELDKDPDLLNLDKVKASPSATAGANLEPCDFLSRDKKFKRLAIGAPEVTQFSGFAVHSPKTEID